MSNEVNPQSIEANLVEKIKCDYVVVDGDGRHFQTIIVSEEFDKKSRVQRHQIVYKALGDRMQEEIHALSMKLFTPEEWSKQN